MQPYLAFSHKDYPSRTSYGQLFQSWNKQGLGVQHLPAAPGLLVEYSQLLSVPQLPWEVIAHFVQHAIGEHDEGLRISYQQLIAAARKQIAGIEIWAQAQEECMGTQMDIPELAMAICWEEVSEELLVSSKL